MSSIKICYLYIMSSVTKLLVELNNKANMNETKIKDQNENFEMLGSILE